MYISLDCFELQYKNISSPDLSSRCARWKKKPKEKKKNDSIYRYSFKSISCEIKIPEKFVSFANGGCANWQGRSPILASRVHKKMLFAGLSSFSRRSAVSRFLFIPLLILFLVAGKVVSSGRWVVALFPSTWSNHVYERFRSKTKHSPNSSEGNSSVTSKNSFSYGCLDLYYIIYYNIIVVIKLVNSN